MDVSDGGVRRGPAPPGAAWTVRDAGNELAAHFGENLFVYVPGGELRLEPVVRVHVAGIVVETLRLHVLVVLVVPGPDDDAGVVAKPHDVFPGLALDRGEEAGVRGVVAAGKHEVLPDQDPHLVAGVVEGLVLVDAAAPDADHALVPLDDEPEPVAVPLAGDAGREAVGGDPVAAAAEDGDLVDLEEGGARLAEERPLDEAEPAQTDAPREAVELVAVAAEQGGCDGVQGLLAVAGGIPELRVLDLEGGLGGARRGVGRRRGHALAAEADVEADPMRGALDGGAGDDGGGPERGVDVNVDVGQARAVHLETNGPPGAAGQEHGAPVPALRALVSPGGWAGSAPGRGAASPSGTAPCARRASTRRRSSTPTGGAGAG